ncbi:MAG TPA: hypothetical protein VHB21_23865 [Minicystis sp.]|nr:hypothetical protein [Minicystis sp.]
MWISRLEGELAELLPQSLVEPSGTLLALRHAVHPAPNAAHHQIIPDDVPPRDRYPKRRAPLHSTPPPCRSERADCLHRSAHPPRG